MASFGNTRYFEGLHYVVGFLFSLLVFQTVFNAMWFILTIVGLKRLFKRMWIVGIAATVVFTFLAARGLFVDAPGVLWINIAIAVIVVGIITVLAIHVGLLATVLAFGSTFAAHGDAMELRHERLVLPAVGACLPRDGRR